MKRTSLHLSLLGVCSLTAAVGVTLIHAVEPPEQVEQERSVKEAEVPKAALDALKKLAASNTLTEFAEEIEHGVTYYEGSWKGPNGKVDALVTAHGDLVELEEVISVGTVPKVVLESAQAAAGKDSKLFVEKKTVIFYEVKYRKGNHKHEVVYSADGREHEHEEEGVDAEGDD